MLSNTDFIHEKEARMEGWLFLNKSNHFGRHNIRKMYFVLEDFYLKSFISNPTSDNEIPVGNAIIDSCIQVIDNGRRNIHNKAFFFFTICLINSNPTQKMKLAATSQEDARKWIHSLKESTIKKQCPHNGKNIAHFFNSKWQSIKMSHLRMTQSSGALDCIPHSSTYMDVFTSHVNTPSSWKIINCVNGLRIFREARTGLRQQLSSAHPAIMAVGIVDGSPEAIFNTLMSLGSSRSEWDFCLYKAIVIEQLDDQTDIIYKQLEREWLPWRMQKRDLLLCRQWRLDDNGAYGGGYIITPTNQGKQSIVKHMLAIDWKSWRSQLLSSSARSVTINMLERVAALREMFKEKSKAYDELIREIDVPEVEAKVNNKTEVDFPVHIHIREQNNLIKDEVKRASSSTNLAYPEEEPDKFFDVYEPTVCDNFENERSSSESSRLDYEEFFMPKIPTDGTMKFHDPSAQEEFQESVRVEDISCNYGSTLPIDLTSKPSCNCTTSDPSLFSIRGKNYLKNQQKVKAKEPMMQLVGADWIKSNKREDNLAQRPGGIVQKYASQGGSKFFIVINLQVPGATTHNLAMYYFTRTPLKENPLLERFVKGNDAFRNSRFKLIPYISKGPWVVKQSVRRKPCLLGKALDIKYSRGKNYLEMNVDVGSSKVAKRVVNLVLGYVNNLVIELAFLIQANKEEELPEWLLGTCHLNQLDASKAFTLN